MEKINVESKSSEFVSIMNEQFKRKINFVRLKLISMFVIALCKVQTVGFEKLANAFDTKAKADSRLRRIQRFNTPAGADHEPIIIILVANKFEIKRQLENRTAANMKRTDTLFFIFLVFNVVIKNT